MNAATLGPALGKAACHVERAYRELVRLVLVLDAHGFDVTAEVAEVIEAVGELANDFTAAADEIGHLAVVERQHRRRVSA